MKGLRIGPILIVFLLWAFGGAAQLNADFSADVRSGCGDLLVDFSSLSSGSPSSYDWDFGDGTANSSLENPSHFYGSPGTYTVSLTVSSGGNNDTETKTAFITVYEKPNNDFTANDTVGCVPFTVTFTDQSMPGDGTLTDWVWDFGDGTISNAQNPVHTYSSPGSYNVTLYTTDNNGCTDEEVKQNFIVAHPVPQASFSASDTLQCAVPETIDFTNNSSGNGLSYEWDFGDGSPVSTATDPSHTYGSFGIFQTQLVVTNADGCSDTAVQTIVNQEFIADFTLDSATGCGTPSISFTDQSSPLPNSWQWDFGDGNTSTQENPTHVYGDTGTYTVTLASSNPAGCSDTVVKTDTITVHPLPSPGYTVSDSTGCQVPHTVDFTDTTSNAVDWQWDFGDGDSSSLENPTHDYSQPGSFHVQLTVIDSNGCTDTVLDSNRVQVIEPVADFSVDTNRGCMPLSVSFADSSFSNETITSWQWDFGDGNTSTLQNPSHTYSDTGSYTVSLAIENNEGCTDTVIKVDTIEVGQPPVVDFFPQDTMACHPFTVGFLDSSSSYADEWEWDFGDGAFSNQQDPTHTYNIVDTFDVTLVAGFHGCYDTLNVTNAINVHPPKSAFTVSPSVGCDTPHTVNFNNVTVNADTWQWNFGDGTTYNGPSPPSHTYNDHGQYTVSLVVTDTTDLHCVDSGAVTVNVSRMDAGFIVDTNAGCNPASISFADTTNSNFNLNQWKWNFGDGTIIGPSNGPINSPNTTGTFDAPVHTYDSSGNYNVTLMVRNDQNCWDTVTYPQFIDIKELPTPALSADTTFGCAPFTVNFTDQSTPDSLITQWDWGFGDGDSSNLEDPVHTYSQPGVFDVSLMVSDTFTCQKEITDTALIQVSFPTAEFTSDTANCNQDSVLFSENATSAGGYQLWDFGDGTPLDTTTGGSLYHFFDVGASSDTVLPITMVAVDSNGCRDTVVKTHRISIPVADFGVDSTTIDCPPFNAQFVDSSLGAVSNWQWNFGDSSGTSNLQNPSHTYSIAGYFDISLIVSTPLGCSDTLVRDSLIQVGGPQGTFNYTVDSSGCFYEVTFVATTQNTDSIKWIFDDGGVASGDSVVHVYTDPGTYIPVMLISDGQGCQVPIQAPSVLELPPYGYAPNFSVTNATCTANDGSVSANPTGGNSPYSFQWSTGDTTSTLNGVPEGSYTLVVTDSTGCTFQDAVQVGADYPPLNIAFTTDSATCLDDDGSATATASGGTWPYSYSWDNGQTGATINNVPAGEYRVEVVDSNGCPGQDSVEIFAKFPSIDAAFVTDTNGVHTGTPITYIDSSTSSLPIIQWIWRFGDGDTLYRNSDTNVTHQYFESGEFVASLVVRTDEGCVDSTTRVIDILEFLEIPNVFTPNGDGKNDVFKVQSSGVKKFSLEVYNRWGQVIFKSERPNVEWSGRNVAGEKVPEGTYFYLLQYTFYSGEAKELQGTVNLFR